MKPTPTLTGRLLPAAALVCAAVLPGAAQTDGRISGQVRDNQGQPLAGATVALRPASQGTATDAEGRFALSGLAPGAYTVTISLVGYRTATQSVTVDATQSASVQATLGEDALLMSGVVVTGTFNPQSKLESSTAVTTLGAREIQNRVSRGTADLLMAVPGFRVNSDGGEAANSVSARGLPVNAEAGFGFIQLMEDGLPILEAGSLTFAKTDIHFRIDETIQRLEVVRGGAAAIYANNAPGGAVNFLSKTGQGDKIGGLLRLTAGDQGFYTDRDGAAQAGGLQRVDANVGGPLAGTPLRFNVGGFYRYDVGTKYPGFPLNRGGGAKGNVTYTLKNGYVRLYGKYLNDRVAYLTSIPYRNLNKPEQIPGGPDFRRGTTMSEYVRRHSLPNPFNNGQGTLERDLADGQHTRYKAVSSEVFFDLGNGFSLQDNARLLDANLTTDGVYDLTSPLPGALLAGSYLAGYRPLGAASARFTYADTGQPVDIATLNGNGLVNIAGIFPDDKPATNAINRLQLNKTAGPHQLTAGFYASRYRIKERLSYNQIVQEVSNRPRLLNLELLNAAGQPAFQVTQNGFLAYSFGTAGGLLANTDNTTQVLSYFAGDEFQVTEKLRLDLGVRYETTRSEGQAAKSAKLVNADARFTPFLGAPTAANGFGGSNGGLDGVFTTLYDNSYLASTGDFRRWDFRFETFNYSVGANYKLSEQAAVYARFSNAGVVPTNDQFAFGVDPADPAQNTTLRSQVQRVLQGEAGVKASTDRLGLGLTFFYSRNRDIPFTVQQTNSGGGFTLRQDVGTVQSSGLEAEITYQPAAGLTLKGIGTLQTPRIVDFTLQPTATAPAFSIAGNRLEDTPDVLLEGGADYVWQGLNVFANYRWFGERYANRRNTILLPSYGVLFGGLGYEWQGVRLTVQGSNLVNTIGFGDAAARNGETISQDFIDLATRNADGRTPAEAAYNLVRPILPRNITASVQYSF